MIVNKVPALIKADTRFQDGRGGVNLSEVERVTGIHYQTVKRWFDGHADRTNFDTYNAWCEFFGQDVLIWQDNR